MARANGRTYRFLVTVELPEGFDVRALEAEEYVTDALNAWCKSMDPDDDIFTIGDHTKVARV